MRTQNGMKVEFVIEVRDTFSNSDVPPFWRPHQNLTFPPNPSHLPSKLAVKFAKERAQSMLGSTCNPDDPEDKRICVKSEWQIVKRVITIEIVDMGEQDCEL